MVFSEIAPMGQCVISDDEPVTLAGIIGLRSTMAVTIGRLAMMNCTTNRNANDSPTTVIERVDEALWGD